MTKQEKRIAALEKEVQELREQLLQLAMRPVYVPVNPMPYNPPIQPQPITVPWTYPWTVTCSSGNVTAVIDTSDVRVYN